MSFESFDLIGLEKGNFSAELSSGHHSFLYYISRATRLLFWSLVNISITERRGV